MVAAPAPTPTRQRHSPGARRTGYLVSVVVNGALLYLAHVRPGWEVVPFLTDQTTAVLPLVSLTLVVGIVANLVYLFGDSGVLRALGDVVTLALGLAALLRIWQVFPFDFGASGVDWALLVRILLALAMVGTAAGLLAAVVQSLTGAGSRS